MEWPAHLSVESSLFWNNGAYSNEAGVNAMMQSLDDDKGFDDKAAVEAADRSNKLDVDPDLTRSATPPPTTCPRPRPPPAPSPRPLRRTTATYAGAFKAATPPPWTAGWTAFPAN